MRKLLFVTRGPFYPECAGGAELSSHFLFQALCRRGWRVEVLCALSDRASCLATACFWEIERRKKSYLVLSDEDLGYTCGRLVAANGGESPWRQCLAERLREYRPDCVLGTPNPFCATLCTAAKLGYPSFYIAHNLAVLEIGRRIPDSLYVIANSPFTASRLSTLVDGEIGIILEMVDRALYRAPRPSGQYITFINPIPEKGVAIAVEVARRLPEEKFLFVKGKWANIGEAALSFFLEPAAAFPNVDIWENQRDVRSVYAATTILLLPSQFLETFGRVIVEAHINGIPVVASTVGGIPYTLGEGGLLIEAKDDAQAYVDAIRRLRTQGGLYQRLSGAALLNSRRPEFDPERQVEAFVQFVESRC